MTQRPRLKIDRDKAIQDNWDAIQTMRRPANMPRISPERLEEIREVNQRCGPSIICNELLAHIDALETEKYHLRTLAEEEMRHQHRKFEAERNRLKERVAKLREARVRGSTK